MAPQSLSLKIYLPKSSEKLNIVSTKNKKYVDTIDNFVGLIFATTF